MANFRQIHVKIWSDPWFLDLEPDLKLLFLYLVTNQLTNLAGIYEIPFRLIEFETGLDYEKIMSGLEYFSSVSKVFYSENLIFVRNLRKYHENSSQKVAKRIVADVNSIGDCPLLRRYIAIYPAPIGYTYDIDTLSSTSVLKEKEYTDLIEYEKDINTLCDFPEKTENPKTATSAADRERKDEFERSLLVWLVLFPEKPQPRATTASYFNKWKARWKDQSFRENWEHALQKAALNDALHNDSWFTYEYFVRNETNYQKLLDGVFDWKTQPTGKVSKQRAVIENYANSE